jgi:hypothetical protein
MELPLSIELLISIHFSYLHEIKKYILEHVGYSSLEYALECACIFFIKKLNIESDDNVRSHLQTIMPCLWLLT